MHDFVADDAAVVANVWGLLAVVVVQAATVIGIWLSNKRQRKTNSGINGDLHALRERNDALEQRLRNAEKRLDRTERALKRCEQERDRLSAREIELMRQLTRED